MNQIRKKVNFETHFISIIKTLPKKYQFVFNILLVNNDLHFAINGELVSVNPFTIRDIYENPTKVKRSIAYYLKREYGY